MAPLSLQATRQTATPTSGSVFIRTGTGLLPFSFLFSVLEEFHCVTLLTYRRTHCHEVAQKRLGPSGTNFTPAFRRRYLLPLLGISISQILNYLRVLCGLDAIRRIHFYPEVNSALSVSSPSPPFPHQKWEGGDSDGREERRQWGCDPTIAGSGFRSAQD